LQRSYLTLELAVFEILNARKMAEGEGVTVNRLFPIPGARMNHDPFVLFDHFQIEVGQGFPTHPHRGFEAITYLFSGAMRHKDNLGNDSVIVGGGAQIFCAGRGISHSEMPESEGTTNGIQLWINLAKKSKKIDPSYQSVDAGELPTSDIGGVLITTIAGDQSPVKLQNKATYQSIRMSQNTNHEVSVAGMRGLIYVVSGELRCDGETVEVAQAVLFDDDNETLLLHALKDCHLMTLYGVPHNEPISQYGPFVD
jgi:hypothetical protein